MRWIAVPLMLALVGASAPALAHPHGADDFEANPRPSITETARAAMLQLVAAGKLPASWREAKLLNRELRTKEGYLQWVVSFQNDAERKGGNRVLYVLMTPGGRFISAEHKLA